jgi:hypothetical protein
MQIFCLYYKDMFVIAFPNRADCIDYGKKHYEGMEWDCNIIEKYLHNSPVPTPTVPYSQPSTTPYTPPVPLTAAPHEPIWTCSDGPKASFSVDYSQTPKTNPWYDTDWRDK